MSEQVKRVTDAMLSKLPPETTPDKTLEELARSAVHQVLLVANQQTHSSLEYTIILDALKSATAAQQREVERLRDALSMVATNCGASASPECSLGFLCDELPKEVKLVCDGLREQLRTERERSERWQSAFHEYGAHWPTCRDFNQCDCGFTALSHSGKEGV